MRSVLPRVFLEIDLVRFELRVCWYCGPFESPTFFRMACKAVICVPLFEMSVFFRSLLTSFANLRRYFWLSILVVVLGTT